MLALLATRDFAATCTSDEGRLSCTVRLHFVIARPVSVAPPPQTLVRYE